MRSSTIFRPTLVFVLATCAVIIYNRYAHVSAESGDKPDSRFPSPHTSKHNFDMDGEKLSFLRGISNKHSLLEGDEGRSYLVLRSPVDITHGDEKVKDEYHQKTIDEAEEAMDRAKGAQKVAHKKFFEAGDYVSQQKALHESDEVNGLRSELEIKAKGARKILTQRKQLAKSRASKQKLAPKKQGLMSQPKRQESETKETTLGSKASISPTKGTDAGAGVDSAADAQMFAAKKFLQAEAPGDQAKWLQRYNLAGSEKAEQTRQWFRSTEIGQNKGLLDLKRQAESKRWTYLKNEMIKTDNWGYPDATYQDRVRKIFKDQPRKGHITSPKITPEKPPGLDFRATAPRSKRLSTGRKVDVGWLKGTRTSVEKPMRGRKKIAADQAKYATGAERQTALHDSKNIGSETWAKLPGPRPTTVPKIPYRPDFRVTGPRARRRPSERNIGWLKTAKVGTGKSDRGEDVDDKSLKKSAGDNQGDKGSWRVEGGIRKSLRVLSRKGLSGVQDQPGTASGRGATGTSGPHINPGPSNKNDGKTQVKQQNNGRMSLRNAGPSSGSRNIAIDQKNVRNGLVSDTPSPLSGSSGLGPWTKVAGRLVRQRPYSQPATPEKKASAPRSELAVARKSAPPELRRKSS